MVIVGAGFGGLRAAKALAGAPVDVVLVDKNNYHLFQPLLYQVASAALPPAEVAYPVRGIFRRQRNLAFRVAGVVGFDIDRRVVLTSRGEIPYDYLILAAGAATRTFGLAGVERYGFDLKSLPGAVHLRNHVLRCFEEAVSTSREDERRALLTIAVVGGGPTGVEVAGAMSELLRRVLIKDYATLSDREVSVLLLEAGTRVLTTMPERLSGAAAASLRKLGVDVRFGAMVADYDGRSITLKSGDTIPARTLVWAAGVGPSPLAAALGVPTSPSGRVIVQPDLSVPGHPEIFVIGDSAYLEQSGEAVPMLAPPAMQMGVTAARNIVRRLEGKPAHAFRYKDPGTMATIGRSAAVAVLGSFQFRGFIAWLIWLFVHLMQLVGFRNRVVVLLDWAWQYLFYRPASPLIVEDERPAREPAPQ